MKNSSYIGNLPNISIVIKSNSYFSFFILSFFIKNIIH